MRVLVTGALGLLGRETLHALARGGHTPVAFDRPGSRRRAAALRRGLPDLEIRFADVRDEAAVAAAVRDVDAVIHDASILWPQTERQPALARSVNVGGTATLVRALQATGRSPRLIYASSVTVFGPDAPTETRHSESPTRATDHYTRTKLEAESVVRSSTLPWTILRIGVSLDPKARVVDRHVLRTLFAVHPEQPFEYVSPGDVARAQANAVDSVDAVGKILLIGGGPGCRTTFGELFDTIFESLGLEPPPWDRYGTKAYYTGLMDTEESQHLLHYQREDWQRHRTEQARELARVRRWIRPVRGLVRAFLCSHLPPGSAR